MKEQQLFIPSKIKVGYQDREGTYTKKLAYVIYYDNKDVLRKEKSWDSWRDHKINPSDFTNEPTEGFVLNKGVGGNRASYGWNSRNEYIRVYDPRDFEFEISVANLLFILRECDCSRGKGLEGKFVYAWDKTELILLPVVSSDYVNSKKYTDLQNQSIKAKELVAGASYLTKTQENLVYLGKFDYFINYDYYNYKQQKATSSKKYIFWEEGKKDVFVVKNDLKSLATVVNPDPTPDLAEKIQEYYKSPSGSKVVKLFLKPTRGKDKDKYDSSDTWYVKQSDTCFVEYNSRKNTEGNVDMITRTREIVLENNRIISRYPSSTHAYSDAYRKKNATGTYNYGGHYNYSGHYGYSNTCAWVDPTYQSLWAVLESGAEYKYCGYQGLMK